LLHGLWYLSSSWERWAIVFEQAGYAPLTPGWLDDPDTVEAARANTELFRRHTLRAAATRRCDRLDAQERSERRRETRIGTIMIRHGDGDGDGDQQRHPALLAVAERGRPRLRRR